MQDQTLEIITKTYKEFRAEWKNLSEIDDESENPYKESDLEMKFYKDDKCFFSVTRCFYESDPDKNNLLVEWIEFNEKIYLIVSHTHGCLTVFDPETGEKLGESVNNDMFLSDYRFYDDKEYLYLSGWFWSPLSMRRIFHIPTFLQTPLNYEPIMVTCANANPNNRLNPGFDIYGCSSCKEFLEKQDQIVSDISHKNQKEKFNKYREIDTLLRRLYEVDNLVDYDNIHGDSKLLLGQILSNDREIFYVKSIGNISGDELGHGWSLTNKLESKYDNFNYVLSDTLFRCVDKMPLEEINFRFEIYTDLGNIIISLYHKLIPCNNLKESYGDDVSECLKDRTKKIDSETKMNIKCSIIQ